MFSDHGSYMENVTTLDTVLVCSVHKLSRLNLSQATLSQQLSCFRENNLKVVFCYLHSGNRCHRPDSLENPIVLKKLSQLHNILKTICGTILKTCNISPI